MGHQTISIGSMLAYSALIMGSILSIVFFVLRVTNKKLIKAIWNYPLILSLFKKLKHDIQYASNTEELEYLEKEIDTFYYKFDSVKAHDVVIRFFIALRDQVRYKKQEFKDNKRAINPSAAVIIFIVVMSLLGSL